MAVCFRLGARNLFNSFRPLLNAPNVTSDRAVWNSLLKNYRSSSEKIKHAQQEVIQDDREHNRLLTKETINQVNSQLNNQSEGRLFAVIHVAGKQFKVTSEDIIIVQGRWPPQPNDVINFEKILLVGAKDFSLIGRPVLPSGLVSVQGTIVEKDLSHSKTVFFKKKRKQYQRLNFYRIEHTMVRINEIKITGKVGEDNMTNVITRVAP